MATCPTCEAEFTPNPERPAQTYCRLACKERAAARRRRAPIVAANRAAREAERAARSTPQVKVCGECSTEYSGRGHRYCSEACARLGQRRKNLLRYGTTPEEVDNRVCRRCGGTKGQGRQVCPDCRARAEREERHRAKRRRKAVKRGVPTEPYTLAEIAARDHYRCGLCRKRVAMTKVVPHPRSPTIDHVLPLADGGHDVRANVQLAHFLCNSTKSNRGTQQLALIG